MFLLKLYQFNKLAFVLFASFIIAFIFLNYKWGLVATPIYQFGMFSGIETIKTQTNAYSVYVNNQLLNLNNYTAPELDLILIPARQYLLQKSNNESVYYTFKNVFSKVGISGLLKEKNFRNDITTRAFSDWYKSEIGKQLYFKVESVKITSRNYFFINGQFFAADSSKIEFEDVK